MVVSSSKIWTNRRIREPYGTYGGVRGALRSEIGGAVYSIIPCFLRVDKTIYRKVYFYLAFNTEYCMFVSYKNGKQRDYESYNSKYTKISKPKRDRIFSFKIWEKIRLRVLD